MAVDVRYRISAEDDTRAGVASAKRGLADLGGGVNGFSRSLKDAMKPMRDLSEGLSSLLRIGGAVEVLRMVSRGIGDIVTAYAGHDKAFAATVASLQSSVSDLKAGMGRLIAETGIVAFFAEVTAAMVAAQEQARNLAAALKGVSDQASLSDLEAQWRAVMTQARDLDKQIATLSKTKNALNDYFIGELKVEQTRLRDIAMGLQRRIVDLQNVRDAATAAVAAGASGASAQVFPTIYSQVPNYAAEPMRIGANGYDLGVSIGTAMAEAFITTLEGTDFGSLFGGMEAAPGVSTGWQAEFGATSATALGEASRGTSIRDASRGSGGLEQMGGIYAAQQAMQQFGQRIQQTTISMGGFAGNLVQATISGGALGLLFELLKPVISGMMDVIAPAINAILVPLFGALVVIGQALGNMLLPIIEALMPVFNAVGQVMVALVPVIQILARPIGLLASVIGWVLGKISYGIDQFLTWIGKTFPALGIRGSGVADPGSFGDMWAAAWARFTAPLTTPTWTDTTAAGTDYITGNGGVGGGGGGGGAGGTTGAGAQYTQARQIIIQSGASMITVNTDVIAGPNSFQDFALMVRNEIARLDALGY